MQEYLTPAGPGEAKFTEKRSDFLGHVRMVETEEDARAFIEAMKKQYYDARHNCWCYAIKDGPVRYSDDGEPQGTAGVPMLEMFQRQEVTNFVCVVTRYFGGILLGTGGLARAYTAAAKDALSDAGLARMALWQGVRLSCPYPQFQRLRRLLEAHEAVIQTTDFGAEVCVQALLPANRTEEFADALTELSAGGLVPDFTHSEFRGVPVKK